MMRESQDISIIDNDAMVKTSEGMFSQFSIPPQAHGNLLSAILSREFHDVNKFHYHHRIFY